VTAAAHIATDCLLSHLLLPLKILQNPAMLTIVKIVDHKPAALYQNV